MRTPAPAVPLRRRPRSLALPAGGHAISRDAMSGGATLAPGALDARTVAAVDLGSNSFHMLVARDVGGQLQVIDRLREPIRLAAGLDERRHLSQAAQQRALECLRRFGQRLRGLPDQRVRVVGTNTLRRMREGGRFVRAAELALGHPIEIISGVEEARLVYSGVTRGMGPEQPRRLIVDIGGGSTELIIGRLGEPKLMESVTLGCVLHTQRFFPDGVITRARMRSARLAARVDMEFLERRYRQAGWDVAIGASGTVRGAWRVMVAQRWADDAITREAIEKAINLTVDAGHVRKIDFPGLREDRRPVFAGGLAVLAAVFDTLGLRTMQTSEYALREGVVYDLLGRLSDRDVRSRSVAAMARRYGVDLKQSQRVERTALRALDQVLGSWDLDRRNAAQLLSWASQLHEIGLVVAHEGYQRHGEYILRHGDLFGFSRSDQQLLACLVRLQRGKFGDGALDELPAPWRVTMRRLAMLFRLAVLLNRARTPYLAQQFQLRTLRNGLGIRFPKKWLESRPLTRADLEDERDYLADSKLRLVIETE